MLYVPVHVESTVFIGDIHGDPTALRDSLARSGMATKTRSSVKVIRPDRLILLGDLPDRGNNTLGTFDLIRDIMDIVEETRLHILAGNHDFCLLQAIEHPEDASAVDRWMWMNGFTVLQEVAKKFGLSLAKPAKDAFPVPLQGITGFALLDILMRWQVTVTRHHMERIDFPAAFERFRELFRQRYEDIFASMELAHRQENTLAVHAGINRGWAESIERAEEAMLKMQLEKDYTAMAIQGDATSPSEIVWRRRRERRGGEPFSEETADILKSKGIDVLVHGHQFLHDGKQRLTHDHGIAVINADAGTSRGYDRLKNRLGLPRNHWAYVRIDEQRNIIAESEAGGVQDFGRIVEGRYQPPEKP